MIKKILIIYFFSILCVYIVKISYKAIILKFRSRESTFHFPEAIILERE